MTQVRWIAECWSRDCATNGRLVMSFADPTTRDNWADAHTAKLGHITHCYTHHFELEEYADAESED